MLTGSRRVEDRGTGRGRPRRRRVALTAALTVLTAVGAIGVSMAPADPASPFAITNVDGPDPIASGAELTYTITVVNTGGARINNVVLSDQVNGVGGIGVPPQLVLTSTRGTCAQNANLVTCSAGSIEGLGSWTVTIRGVVTAANGATLNNTASVTGTKSAQNFTSTATATTLVSNGGGGPLPDLTIAKAGPTSVVVSSPMTYTLTVNNMGTANATGVRVVDTVPAGLTGITATGTSLFECSVSGQTVNCVGGAVNQGSNATITINATSPAAVGTITNTATVDPENTIAESNDLNNSSALVDTQVTAGPPAPSLSINKTDDPAVIPGAGPDPVNPGAFLTYKILVTNTSAYRADDVVMVDGTQGLEAASISVSQVIMGGTVGHDGGCTVAAPQVRCLARTLDPGGTIRYTVTGRVVASAGSTIFNTATVTGNIRNQGVSSTDSEITTVRPAVDLTVTKADSPDPVCARSWPGPGGVCQGGLTYTFVVGNSGTQTASGVVLRDPLAPGLIFDSYANVALFDGGFACAVDGANVVTCTGGTIPPASIRKVTFLLVAPGAIGTITNIVTVDPYNAIFEADETNNTATETTQVATGIDLTIAKSGVFDTVNFVATGGTQTYTLTVRNIGTQDASGIQVRDTLPAGSIFRDAIADPAHGFTCGPSGGVVDCVGGHLLGTESMNYPPVGPVVFDTATITIRIFAITFEGTMHNEARVDPNNLIGEADENNNIATQDTAVGSGDSGHGAFNELWILKTQLSPANPVARNAVVTYQIVVHNDGTDPAVGVAVRDFLPAGSRYIEATGTNQFLCLHSSGLGQVDCTGGVISAGGTATLTVKVFAPDTPNLPGQHYTNQAIVDPDHAIPEGNEFNNASSVDTIVQNGGNGAFNDLQIEKTGTANTTPGGTINYTVKVWNMGTDPAADVVVRDVLPVGTTFVSATDNNLPTPAGAFTCGASGGVVNCIGGQINAGLANARFIHIVVTAPNHNVPSPGLTNQASVDPDNAVPEGDEENNAATFHTTVQSVINLKITKDGPDTASQSEVKDYTIKVKNEAPGGNAADGLTAFGVQMHDPLPVGLIPLAVDAGSGNNWACQVGENPINVVDCLGDLNPEQEVTITITVFITAENNRSLDNEACVDPDDLIEEFNPPGESDNCSTHTTPVGPAPKRHPDLLVTKTASPASATPDQDLTYTISVQNLGDADAQGPVTITDELPAQTTFVSAAGTDWACPAPAGGVLTCTLAAGLSQGATANDITLVVHVDITATGSITNTAVAAPATSNPAESDAENEVVLDNNDSTVVRTVGEPGFDLAIVSIVDNPDPAIRGQQLVYTVVGINTGTDAANGVHIAIDIPPSGATLVGAAGSNGFNCGAPVSNTIDCVGDLPGGGDTAITLSFLVNLTAGDDLTLSATIDPANAFPEADDTNNTQSETTTVTGGGCATLDCIDLVAAQLSDSPDPVQATHDVTYSLVVANIGALPAALSGSQLAFFDLFGDVTLVSYGTSNPAITCSTFSSSSSALLSDCFGDLGAGESVTLTITVTVNSGATVAARGLVDPINVVSEFNDFDAGPPQTFGNNLIFQTTTVTP